METSDTAIEIKEAYNKLSSSAFSVWIALLAMDQRELKRGIEYLAKTFGYAPSGLHRIIRELKNKDFVRLKKSVCKGKPTTILINKRAILSGKHGFVVFNIRKYG